MQNDAEQQNFLSVSDACALVQGAFSRIGELEVVGEVSEASPPNRSGHVYATIKDDKTVLSLAIFKYVYAHVGLPLKIGDQIKVKGRFSYYEPTGRTSFIVSDYAYYGEGHLKQIIEERRKKLEREGLFSAAQKQRIPAFAERVVVVTSPTGAVIEDVRRTLARRNPLVKLGYVGCAVQGKEAPASIVEALKKADETNADVILLVRGGGSLEDLMPFNSEEVVRAIAALQKPVVTGIGHEPDTSLADLVADLRASTPTAAAEAVAPTAAELEMQLRQLAHHIDSAVLNVLSQNEVFVSQTKREMLSSMNLKLATLSAELRAFAAHPELKRPDSWIEIRQNRLVMTEERLLAALQSLFVQKTSELDRFKATLLALSPKNVLKRGYALVSGDDGVITSVGSLKKGDKLHIEFEDGSALSTIDSVERK